ncbi:dihydroorotate dehydrogenase [Candidatus Gottesmanbacteria bacterium]|nr:dihydroorotate dehydrogenase [Candidatus Gottesmanbacteria bacterium]
MADLSIKFLVTFSNPFILPSGIITEIPDHKKAIEAGAGGITLKTITKEKREGNPLPRLWKYEHGMLNSVGLRNPGIDEGIKQIEIFLKENPNFPIIVSLFATDVKEFAHLVEKIVPLSPPFIELNLSCPNTTDELGNALGMDEGAAEKVTKAVKMVSGKVTIIAKLSPNVSEISEVAKACESVGADAISAINTVGPGMIIDIMKKKPVIGNKEGGVSGPAILPIAIRCVYDIYEAVKIPIIGIGGVEKIEGAIQMFMAGATLVGVGTATYTKGMKVYEELKKDLSEYMEKNNLKSLQDFIGAAHN